MNQAHSGADGGDDDARVARIRDRLRQPGASRASIERYIGEELGLAPADAAALAAGICRRLLDGEFPPLTEVELVLTEDCNQRCDYCFVEGKNAGNRMPWDVARRAVDFLLEQSRDKPEVKVLFFGGEPLLEYELVLRVADYAAARAAAAGKRVRFDMTTNGTRLDAARAAALAARRIMVLISMDGDRDTHDRHRKTVDGRSSYEAVLRGLPAMRRHQPWLGARMTVHPDTVDAVARNVAHLAGLGFCQFIVGTASGVPWSDAELDRYVAQMLAVAAWLRGQLETGRRLRVTAFEETPSSLYGRRHVWGCRAGRHSLTVTARGDLYPCSKMLGLDGLRGVYPLGTLDDGITEIYNRLVLCGRVPVDRGPCLACEYADCCTGGCFAVNRLATGDIFKPDPQECRFKRRTAAMILEARQLLGSFAWPSETGPGLETAEGGAAAPLAS